MKRITGVAIVVALMSVSLVVEATAHSTKVRSHVTFNIDRNGGDANDNRAHGKVTSRRHSCERSRLVEFYRVADGRRDDQLVANTVTNANGNYSVFAGAIARGTYYAKAVRKVVNNSPGHFRVCKRAFSDEETVVGGGPLRAG